METLGFIAHEILKYHIAKKPTHGKVDILFATTVYELITLQMQLDRFAQTQTNQANENGMGPTLKKRGMSV